MTNILFYHGTTAEGLRFTIAGNFDPELRLGLSLCAKGDKFCKKTGRIKAEGRMKQTIRNVSRGLLIVPETTDPKETIRKFIDVVSAQFEGQSKKSLQSTFNLDQQ